MCNSLIPTAIKESFNRDALLTMRKMPCEAGPSGFVPFDLRILGSPLFIKLQVYSFHFIMAFVVPRVLCGPTQSEWRNDSPDEFNQSPKKICCLLNSCNLYISNSKEIYPIPEIA